MVERLRYDNTKTKTSKSMTLASERFRLFGKQPLLMDEDAAMYQELLARVRAAVKPVDIIDDMLITDVVDLEWEVLRWRRLKTSLVRSHGLNQLERFLESRIEYNMYSDCFAMHLAELLQEKLPRDQEAFAEKLAHRFAQHESDAVDKVYDLVHECEVHNSGQHARADSAQNLVEEYVRRETDAVRIVDKMLAKAGMNMDVLTATALVEHLESIEQIVRLTTAAEARRNASLREIDRRRAILGDKIRRSVQEIEDAEFEAIESTPSKGNKAA